VVWLKSVEILGKKENFGMIVDQIRELGINVSTLKKGISNTS